MEPKNIDDVLVKSMNEQQGIVEPVARVEPPLVNEKEQEQPSEQDQPYQEAAQKEPDVVEDDKPLEGKNKESPSDSPIDEYGNPIEKPRMYTEEEVQQKIRDRLSRGRYADQQPTQQQVKQTSEEFKSDPESDESWEKQLESFIDRTIDKRNRASYEQQWRQQEEARQVEFESKFTNGMNKYSDFHQVVSGQPITDTMMLATRSLENPAAFVYGASKMHPKELDRISKISDPYVQASEIGRLHERMVKERRVVSQANKPLESPKGDMPVKQNDQMSIDSRIMQHAKQKFSRK